MTAEEQIFAYKELRNKGQAFFIDNYEDADRIIEALEKQIPKKPIIKTNLMTKHVSAHCSICDTDITYYSSGENYCHNCSQAIKWE